MKARTSRTTQQFYIHTIDTHVDWLNAISTRSAHPYGKLSGVSPILPQGP